MLYLIILLAVFAFIIIFVLAPAVVCYRSVFGRRKVLPLGNEKLYKPAIEPYKERMIADLKYLKKSGCEQVEVKAKDGVTLCADYYGRGAAKTAIMVHGFNADPYVNLVSPARWLYDRGFNLLVIYQRAHGRSGGKRTGMGCLERYDIPVWIDEVLRRDPSHKILLYGTSMGGTTLAYLSDTLDVDNVPCMVIDCGYISTENQLRSDAKRMHLPPLLVPFMRLFCRFELHIDISERTTEHLKKAKKPILFIHGTADMTVALEEGRANYQACSSDKELVVVEGAAHTTAFQTDEAQVTAALNGFLEKYFDNETNPINDVYQQ